MAEAKRVPEIGNMAPSQTTESMSGGKLKSASQYLRGVPETYRAKVSTLYRDHGGYEDGWFNDEKRELLAESVFEVVNDLEHRHANKPESKKPKAVGALFDAMNRIYTDLGWNEV